MATQDSTATAPYDLSQAEEDMAGVQGAISNLEEVMYLLLTSPQPPNALTDRVQHYANAAQQLPAYMNPTGYNGVIPATNTVWQPGNQVTGTSLSNLASQTILNGDPCVNSMYELDVWGNITTGTTAETLELAVNLGGSAASNVTLGTSFWGVVASQAWRFYVKCRVMVSVTGASGVWNSMLFGAITTTSNVIGGSGSQNDGALTASESTGTISLSTLQNNQFGLLAAWGGTTGAPSITSRWASYRKIF
jgi:hypothetical protein